jgi:hypothetical protein
MHAVTGVPKKWQKQDHSELDCAVTSHDIYAGRMGRSRFVRYAGTREDNTADLDRRYLQLARLSVLYSLYLSCDVKLKHRDAYIYIQSRKKVWRIKDFWNTIMIPRDFGNWKHETSMPTLIKSDIKRRLRNTVVLQKYFHASTYILNNEETRFISYFLTFSFHHATHL